MAFDSGVGVQRQGGSGSGENGVWQQQQRVIRAGTQQSINDLLQWIVTRHRGLLNLCKGYLSFMSVLG